MADDEPTRPDPDADPDDAPKTRGRVVQNDVHLLNPETGLSELIMEGTPESKVPKWAKEAKATLPNGKPSTEPALGDHIYDPSFGRRPPLYVGNEDVPEGAPVQQFVVETSDSALPQAPPPAARKRPR